ncbi:hypothetical protein KAR91_88125 [Candidatus Pacearchaeota archaeon]|nr:hypothetical protein [Candidatus Pacearchaeota archaeon]
MKALFRFFKPLVDIEQTFTPVDLENLLRCETCEAPCNDPLPCGLCGTCDFCNEVKNVLLDTTVDDGQHHLICKACREVHIEQDI